MALALLPMPTGNGNAHSPSHETDTCEDEAEYQTKLRNSQEEPAFVDYNNNKEGGGAEDMVQWLTALAATVEDVCSCHRTHKENHNHL